jgi:hypothetical protein
MVFCASTGTILTTLGIVPLQAGIFTTRTIPKHWPQPVQISQKYINVSLQNSATTVRYAQSTYGIVSMNATLPPFMTRNYTLAPFRIEAERDIDMANYHLMDQFVANTTLYSMDVLCKAATPNTPTSSSIVSYNVSADCTVDLSQFGNRTVGEHIEQLAGRPLGMNHGTYNSFYTSYFGRSTAGQTLGVSTCDFDNGTFFAAFARNKALSTDAPGNISAVLCKPVYYQQSAQATISYPGTQPTATPSGTKEPIPATVFNTTVFEITLASGARNTLERADGLPGVEMPRYFRELQDKEVTPVMMGEEFNPTSAMALGMTSGSIESLLDPLALGEAYAAAYRLLFVRAMTGYLEANFSDPNLPSIAIADFGWGIEHREVVALEPVFTYLVEALLALVSLTMGVMLYHSVFKRTHGGLVDDPGMCCSCDA